jgi:hypothetical protein
VIEMTKLRILLFVLCLIVSLSFPLMGNAGDLNITGYLWAVAPDEFKLGFAYGWDYAGNSELISTIKQVYEYKKKCQIDVDRIVEKVEKEAGINFYSIDARQIVDTIGQIYSEPRVKNWEITRIMPMVRGRLKGGWTLQDLDEVISYRIKERELGEKLLNPTLSHEDRVKISRDLNALKKPKVLD